MEEQGVSKIVSVKFQETERDEDAARARAQAGRFPQARGQEAKSGRKTRR